MSTRQPRLIAIVISILLILSFVFILNRSAQAAESVIVVNSSADVGSGGCDANECTLREAIVLANTRPGEDKINFSIPGSGVHTIQPMSALPEITESVLIDGYSQAGTHANTNPTSLGVNTVLMIELDGSLADGNGLTIRGGTTTVRGLVINRFSGYAVLINSSGKLEGNFLGVDPTGKINMGGGAILVEPNSSLTVGDLSPAARNLIVGSIRTLVGQVTLRGNLIGTDSSGLVALGQSDIFIGKGGLTAGGTTPEARNIIIGTISVDRSTPLDVEGNYIGVDVNGQKILGQGGSLYASGNGGYRVVNNVIKGSSSDGVTFELSYGSLVALNRIEGHSGAGVRLSGTDFNEVSNNTITNNLGAGIVVVRGGDGIAKITGNRIFHNGGLGIDLNNDGVTSNDLGDGDLGPNKFQNFPVLLSAENNGDTLNIIGTFNSEPNSKYTLEFFANPVCDVTGYGEGEKPVGALQVATDDIGNANIAATTAVASVGDYVTAIAIDNKGNTSEYAQCIQVIRRGATLTLHKDSQPNSTQDFVYYGPFGKFFLDDAVPDDGDSVPNFVTYRINPGTYNFAEGVFQAWYLADIVCVGSGQSTKNILNRSVAITVNTGDQMTCTFVTQRRVNLQAAKFNDLNSDSIFAPNESYLPGWEMLLYDGQNMRLLGKVTDNNGSAIFNNRIPGTYKLCETPKTGWTNSLPGAIDTSLGRPCYRLTLQPGQNASVLFGNTQGAVVRPLEEIEPSSGVTIGKLPDINEPEGNEPLEDEFELQVFLPLISH